VRRWLFLLLVPLVPIVQQRVDARLDASPVAEGRLYAWSGQRLKRLLPGFENVLADVYWLRTVQYFGAQRVYAADKRFDLLDPLIDVTVTLDPRLEVAYRYGAIFLCEPWPTGKGDPQAGSALLERGVRALPASWRLRQDLGFYRYVFLGDATGGAQVLLDAAGLPDAPFYLESLAGMLLARGGQRSTARQVWRRMYDQGEAGFIRENALYNLQRLDALDALDALNAAVERYRERAGRPPAHAQEVLSVGVDRRLLTDPLGVPFAYEPARGRFWFGQASRLWRPEGN
jgi:hypothetical protein